MILHSNSSVFAQKLPNLARRAISAPRARQRGMGFFGLLFFAAVIGSVGYIALKAFPAYAEYMRRVPTFFPWSRPK